MLTTHLQHAQMRKLSINGQTGNIIIIYIYGSATDNQVTPPDVKSPCCLTVAILKKMGRLEEGIYSINPPFSLFFSLFPFLAFSFLFLFFFYFYPTDISIKPIDGAKSETFKSLSGYWSRDAAV